MRGKLFILLMTGVVITGEAKETKDLSQLETYRIGYTDGYEEGKRKGIEEGYRLALEDFRKVYQEKLKEYEEIEAGRLLLKESRISYPRVYTTGGGRLVITGCQLIRPADDLLAKIPQRGFEMQNSQEDLPIKGITLSPYRKVAYCGPEEKIREFSPVYYRKESTGCYVVYFEREEAVLELCKTGVCK